MARILAISSQVARGAVGLSAIVPALQALGHDVIALPTVLLSNHPGHDHVSGTRIAPETLAGMLAALGRNGWLTGLDAVLTGYLPSVEHVAFAVEAITRVRAASPAALHLCDPVLGDAPKGLYIAEDAARALRDTLVRDADVVKLNRFEASWIAGDACAVPKLGRMGCVVTSAAGAEREQLVNVACFGEARLRCRVAERTSVPKGTGDLFSGLLLGYRLTGDEWGVALGRAVAAVDETLAAGDGDALAIVAAMPRYRTLAPFPVETAI
ncbi:MAG: pyridoxal kinase [Hyphomicrobiaceae bacterium]